LESIYDSDQIRRYKRLPNLILTNFTEFHHFRDGQKMKMINISNVPLIAALHVPKPKNLETLNELLKQFLSFSVKHVYDARTLAVELANRAQLLRRVTTEELESGSELINSQQLIEDLTTEDFSDMYAQTIVYGLFFARMQALDNSFYRSNAYSYIPSSIPLLRELFYYLIGPYPLSKSLEFIVDDIVEVLKKTDLSSIAEEFHTETWTDDPVIQFYETFLRVYNPTERNRRGVFYTPMPVVSYIVESVHELLKSKLKILDGLADRNVTLLDPSAGTMTFPTTAIKLCYQEYKKKGKEGIFNQLIKRHLLKNFYAFEVLIAPYAIGHFKVNNQLRDLGYVLTSGERFQLFLTNTLETHDIGMMGLLPLNEENKKAKEIKEKTRILVICGNPPYSVRSMNRSDFIEKLMATYKKNLNEKNIQPLSDDYIKFIRFAQWKIEQTGSGLVGLITNNSYLDGLIHRQMRKNLLDTFDLVYILNLHGSLRRGIAITSGDQDENVFDILQGIAISIFVKLDTKTSPSRIFYTDLSGSRQKKYSYLLKNSITTTEWKEVYPKAPLYFFVPKEENKTIIDESISLKEIFIENKTSVKTHRDKFIVSRSSESLKDRLDLLMTSENLISNDYLEKEFSLKNTNDWSISTARDRLRHEGIVNNKIKLYNYRPFDIRWLYHSDILVTRHRGELLNSISESNIAIVTTRQIAGLHFSYVFVTNILPDNHLLSVLTKESAYVFPLNKNGRRSNIHPYIIGWLSNHMGKKLNLIPSCNISMQYFIQTYIEMQFNLHFL
jgi:predicted helicase